MKQIQSLPLFKRPREKILKMGAQALNTEELLSAILVTGTRQKSVSSLAQKTAKLISNSADLTKDSLLLLGLGPTKAAQILASIELGKRLEDQQIITLTSAEQVFAQCFEILNSDKEALICFYLNARGELLKKEILALGSLNRVNLLPREIFSLVKELPVASIILTHNHPSGILDPSHQDMLFTKRVKAAAEILGIKLLDHLIVSPKGWKRIKF